MALSVLSAAISQATGGGVSYAINLLLGYMPEHAIIQHRGIPKHSPLCDLHFLRKKKMKCNCLNAGITSNSHERFLGEKPRKYMFRLISLPAVALPCCNLRGTQTKSVKSTGMTWDPVQLKQDTLAATSTL